MSNVIDAKTEFIARRLARVAGRDDDCPWSIEGGGYVPAWAMYVSEAVKAMQQSDLIEEIKGAQ